MWAACCAPLLALLALGLAKVSVGLSRDRPVGILVMGLVIEAVVLLVFLVSWPRWRASAEAGVAQLRDENSGLGVASTGGNASHLTPADVALGVALFGFGPFPLPELEGLSLLLHPPSSGSGSGCSEGGSSCSSCSSGCGGGGGCGGCGS
jgi:hypothetical protein